MKNRPYKILVLSDLKNSVNSSLMNTISLAKIINAEVDFFYVKKPTDIVETENQLSAMRTINKDFFDTDKKIKKLVKPYAADYKLAINSSFSFGNVKDEILKRIEKSQPDIIVLGKRKASALKLMGDNITKFVLRNYNGTLLIASEENGLEPQKELTLGVFNSVKESFNMDFANDLIQHSKKPLKAFKIVEKQIEKEDNSPASDIIEYVFDKNDNTINNLSNYLQKNNINLFCLNREDKVYNNKLKSNTSQFKDVIDKVNVPILLTNNSKEFVLN